MSRWATYLRSIAATAMVAALLCIQPTTSAMPTNPLDDRLLTDAQLFQWGMDTYNRGDWIYAAMHLHAYMQRNPPVLRSDPALAKQVVDAWYYSARQMEKARDEAAKLPACQQQLSGHAGVGVGTAGLTAAAPTVNWNKIKSAARY
jgi:hypothetical protein